MSDFPRQAPLVTDQLSPSYRNAPRQAVVNYENTDQAWSRSPFSRFGKLLPALMISIIPALLLLYVTSRINIYVLYKGAVILTLALIIACGALIVTSGVLGLAAYLKRRGSRSRTSW
ncbi:MAG TPA: hypothetical protein VF572_06170 [Candidatus Saccharimonadales bacterium]|jgi:hypothetical protein